MVRLLGDERLWTICLAILTQCWSMLDRHILHYTGWPNKNCTFLRYHIFAATTDAIMGFCWNVQKLQQKTASDNFLNEC